MTRHPTYPYGLRPRLASGGEALETASNAWRLQVPPARGYALAQLDDYGGKRRSELPWAAPFTLRLRARATANDIPGTWGFGLWNDPFGMGMSFSERVLRLPALPNCAWFFHASPPNYLSLRDDLPSQGWTAGVFRSPLWPAWLLAPAAPGLILLTLPAGRRALRRFAPRIVQQDGARLDVDPAEWHSYALEWRSKSVRFLVDDVPALETRLVPRGRLGVVIWIDNQYLSFTPDGALRYGVLTAPQPAWIEIEDLSITGALDKGITFE